LRQREIEAFLACAYGPRDRLLCQLMLFSGLRVSEACMLRIEHIDFDSERFLVYQGKGSKDRYLPIAARMQRELRDWVGERTSGWMFPAERIRKGPGHVSIRHVEQIIPAIGELAGIPRRITPHKLRHSFACLCLATGATIREVQDLLGHSDMKTTAIYLHVDVSRLKSVVDRL
jgi:integrase/recombinase XerD